MDFEKLWETALGQTEIIRTRIQMLGNTSDTMVPYILLSESKINVGDTIVRQGEIKVSKPSLFVPPNNPQFNGFDFDEQGSFGESAMINYLLVRGISLPSLNYDNRMNKMDMYEGRLSQAIKHYKEDLSQKENVQTGLLVGPEDCWQFSLLIFICSQIARDAKVDIQKLLTEYKKKNQ